MIRIDILLMSFININVNTIYIDNVDIYINNSNVNDINYIYVNITT